MTQALRPDYALLSAEKWKTLFEETGLEFVHATAPLGRGADVVQQAILIGRKPLATDKTDSIAISPGFWVVLGDTKGIAEEVAASDLGTGRGVRICLARDGIQIRRRRTGGARSSAR